MVVEKAKTLTWQDCQTKIGTIPTITLGQVEAFIDGDHWQSKWGWVGWKPESTSDSALATWKFIEESFNAENVIGGMVERIVGAVLGKEPDIKIIPRKDEGETASPEEITLFTQIDSAVSKWWDSKKIHQILKDFVRTRTAYGKSALRIHIPVGYLQSTETDLILDAKTLPDALDRIYLTAHHYSSVIDGLDVSYGEKYGIVRVEQNENENGTTTEDVYEVYYVNSKKETVARVLNATQNKTPVEKTFDLGGNSLLYVDGEYKRALISKTIVKQQRTLNTAKTGENYALNNINFPETTFIDVDLPAEKKVLCGVKKDVINLMAGAGIVRQLFSKLYNTADGGQAPTQGQMITKPVADPKHFATVVENNKRSMHQEASMLYLYLADSEYASGSSKIASMTDYVILLTDEETVVANVGVWLFETVLRLAFRFTNQTALNDKFRVVFTPKLTVGMLSVEERTLMLDEVNAGIRSRRNYRLVAKVTDDPANEEIIVVKEQKERPNNDVLLAQMDKQAQLEIAKLPPQTTPKPTSQPPVTQ